MSLRIGDLNKILTALHPGAVNEWSDLGLKLGLSDDDLNALPDTTNKKAALRKMLAEVLHRKTITWQTIVDALRAINKTNLASDIEKEYLPSSRDDSSNSRKRKLSEEPLESYKKPAFQEAPPIAGAKETDTITPTITPLGNFHYPMDKKTHGVALIINIEAHPNKDKHRHGSKEDRNKLEEALKVLGYKVIIVNDLNSDEFKDTILDHTKKADVCDSFVCCILAHGSKGAVMGADGGTVEVGEIAKALVGVKHLGGKPKMFFIQACQGDERPAGVCVADSASASMSRGESVADSTIPTLPRDSDFFFGFSSSSETISVRNTVQGSRYIQTLCYILQKQYETEDLVTMVTRVHDEVANITSGLKNEEGEAYQQQPQLVSTLRKLVRFKLSQD